MSSKEATPRVNEDHIPEYASNLASEDDAAILGLWGLFWFH